MYGSALYLSVNVVLTLALVQVFGLPGPALADVSATIAMALFLLQRVRSLLDIGWRALFPWGSLFRLMVMAIVAGLLTYPILLLALPKLLTVILLGIVYVPIYLLAAYKLGALERSDIELARDWARLRILFR